MQASSTTGAERSYRPARPIAVALFGDLHDESFIKLRPMLEQSVIPFGRSRTWALVAQKKFPAPRKLPSNGVAWRVGDVRDWLAGTWVAPEGACVLTAMKARMSGASA